MISLQTASGSSRRIFQWRRVAPNRGRDLDLPDEGVSLEQVERDLATQALKRTGWNHTKATALLGLNRDQIRYRIEKFGLGDAAEWE